MAPEPELSVEDDLLQADTATPAAWRPPSYDGWEIDESLRHVRRVLGPVAASPAASSGSATERNYRLDAGHDAPTPHFERPPGPRAKKKRPAMPDRRAPGDRMLALAAWMILLIGTAGFACGVALMAWSMHTGRQELWTIGTPTAFAGQIALGMGLVLQMDRVWRDSRWAVARMETVDEQLQDLKTATTLLNGAHGPSSAFYAHWAGGAGPELLLSDLKSQLDLLAVKLSER